MCSLSFNVGDNTTFLLGSAGNQKGRPNQKEFGGLDFGPFTLILSVFLLLKVGRLIDNDIDIVVFKTPESDTDTMGLFRKTEKCRLLKKAEVASFSIFPFAFNLYFPIIFISSTYLNACAQLN